MKAADYLRRLEAIRTDRGNWEALWQDCSDYVLPRKNDIQNLYSPGSVRTRGDVIFDSTAIIANELLSSTLHSMMTNPSTLWFEVETGIKQIDMAFRWYFQEVTRILHTIYNQSNFQTEIHEIYLDLGCIGTAVLEVSEDLNDVCRFTSHSIAGCYIAENANGMVDTMYREFQYTAKQAFEKYGMNLPPKIIKDAEQNPSEKCTYVHCVKPRVNYNPKKNDALNKPFESVVICKEGDAVVHVGGFNEFPFMVPRWTKISGERYGRSPAMKALPDIKMLNQMSKTIIKAAQKRVDPPLQVPNEGRITVRTMPSGITYVPPGTEIKPINTGADIGVGLELEEQRRRSIRDAFFNDQMQLQQGPTMTATEVLQRTEEKIRLMGPILGRLQNELLKPLIDRTLNIAYRQGIMPPPPQELQGMNVQIKYLSPIAKAQRATESQGLLRTFEVIGGLAQSQPSMLDNFNGDMVARGTADLFSVPAEFINAPEMVEQIREDRAEQMARQQQVQEQMMLADAQAKMQ